MTDRPEDTEQGSDEWHRARLGKLTSSRFSEAIATLKDGRWGASRERLMAQLIVERLTDLPYPQYVSPEMRWGTETQPDAENAYCMFTNSSIEKVGFCPHPTIPMSGASPDGLVGSDGMIECKCPASHTHIATLRGASIPDEYVVQMQWQMACRPERRWCDWVSFDPRMPGDMQLYIKRVPRDNERIAKLERFAADFLKELDSALDDLCRRYRSAA